MKKLAIILAISVVALFATAGSAFANFGPHGGYALDTDACAGCHRAHTSFSNLSWEDVAGNDHSALLVSSAQTMEEFCYACHGDGAPGASTNVEMGLFDSGPSGSATQTAGGSIMYETNSAFLGGLNGGAFNTGISTSMHDMDKGAATDPMWGSGSSASGGTNLTCTGCHDPHGSSNYRLLKDTVNGVTVGGYNGDTPQPFVFSAEQGYPVNSNASAINGGWLKHNPGATQMASYRPNYTTAEYAFKFPAGYSGTAYRSMSTWCAACHTQYDDRTGTLDYGQFESNGTVARDANGTLSVTGGTASVGARARHRHPVNVAPVTVTQLNGWGSDAVTSSVLPLERRPNSTAARGEYELQDNLGCLTCHRAHGTAAQMSGWANARLVNHPTAVVTWTVEPTTTLVGGKAGVTPNVSSALLRTDNRGVCERCHNK